MTLLISFVLCPYYRNTTAPVPRRPVYSAQANVTLVALLETVSTALQLGISRALESLRASLDADPDADLDVIFVKWFMVSLPPSQH